VKTVTVVAGKYNYACLSV